MVHTYFLDGEGDIPLHGEFNRWLNMRLTPSSRKKREVRPWAYERASSLPVESTSHATRKLARRSSMLYSAPVLVARSARVMADSPALMLKDPRHTLVDVLFKSFGTARALEGDSTTCMGGVL